MRLIAFCREKGPDYIALCRLNRPIGIMLLLWPTLIALYWAGKGAVSLKLWFIFIAGTIVMRSAGCIINDWADKQFDKHVQRTKNRPLAAQKLSDKEAWALFFGLLGVAFCLVCLTNRATVRCALMALALATVYPFMKRYTHYPQVVLGAAYASAIPMAYAAQEVPFGLEGKLLYLATVIWALAYDTLYAMADKPEDLKIGVKSTAIAFGKYDAKIVAALQCIVLCILALIAYRLNLSIFFYASLGFGCILILYQQWIIRDPNPQACIQAFLNNQWLGLAWFVGALLG